MDTKYNMKSAIATDRENTKHNEFDPVHNERNSNERMHMVSGLDLTEVEAMLNTQPDKELK